MKLKTLKDFWNILPREQKGFSRKEDVILHSLREEAIKWIKEFRHDNAQRLPYYCYEHGNAELIKDHYDPFFWKDGQFCKCLISSGNVVFPNARQSIADAFMRFFDITDEELDNDI